MILPTSFPRRGDPAPSSRLTVPAKAGIRIALVAKSTWVPAFAGTTGYGGYRKNSRGCCSSARRTRYDSLHRRPCAGGDPAPSPPLTVIPAKAGIHFAFVAKSTWVRPSPGRRGIGLVARIRAGAAQAPEAHDVILRIVVSAQAGTQRFHRPSPSFRRRPESTSPLSQNQYGSRPSLGRRGMGFSREFARVLLKRRRTRCDSLHRRPRAGGDPAPSPPLTVIPAKVGTSSQNQHGSRPSPGRRGMGVIARLLARAA